MEKNKTGKYLKYAIGEIVLVVVGILIALSINNWNENRKLKNQEVILIQNLHADLTKNYLDIKNVILSNSESIDAYQKLRSVVENNTPYSKELDLLFGRIPHWNSPVITSSTYNSMQSNGLALLSNDDLKNDVIEMYDYYFTMLVDDLDKYEWVLNQSVVNPFFSKHFMYDDEISLYKATPNDFESLKKNKDFLNLLSIISRQRKKGQERYERTLVDLEKLIEKLKKELDLRNK